MRASKKGSIDLLSVIFVVFILAVLAALLFPLTRKSRSSAREAQCASNMKECATALHLYWTDYDNMLPSSALVSGSKTWNKRDFEYFATRAGTFPPARGQRAQTWAQILYPYMKSRDIIFCPSDYSDHYTPTSPVSYWWKCAIDRAWYGDGCKKAFRLRKDFARPADQIVLYERAGFHSGQPDGLKNDTRIAAVYLDSHVRHIRLANACRNQYSAPAADPTAPGEPAYFNFDASMPHKQGTNPRAPENVTRFIDPGRYSDWLP